MDSEKLQKQGVMSIYQKIAAVGTKYLGKDVLFKYGFNLSPMYRRSTGRVIQASKDLLHIRIRIKISYKNKNYVSSIFGGSMFSAVDPIPMVQLMNLIGDDYVVWDKSAQVFFKRPAKEHLYADFTYTVEELNDITRRVQQEKEIEIEKITYLTNKDNNKTFCEVRKIIYIADKAFYKEKRKQAKQR